MCDPQVANRVDAVLLADGFYSSYADPRKRVINMAPLEKFVRLADEASHDHKLFGITHTAIPTVDYPSVSDVVGKLLELTGSEKVSSGTVGPRNMHEIYAVDRGSFHVKGYEGILAGDHIRQIQADDEPDVRELHVAFDDDGRLAPWATWE